MESLALRIIVLDPPPDTLWALQLGQDEMVKPSSATKSRISFDYAGEVVDGSSKGASALETPPFKSVAGTGSKGGAACATVPLLGNGWYVA